KRRSAERPSLPFAPPLAAGSAATPSSSHPVAHPTSSHPVPHPTSSHPAAAAYVMPPARTTPVSSGPLPVLSPEPARSPIAMTLIGPVPVTSQLAAVSVPVIPPGRGLPALVAHDDISQIGARSLVTDPKLGWETTLHQAAANDGSHTRMASEVVDDRIRSNARWWVLSVFLVVVLVVMIAIIVQD
ncbi:MAG: hypothetical protein ABIY55_30565, partial [Kofleriaceae bacterium]